MCALTVINRPFVFWVVLMALWPQKEAVNSLSSFIDHVRLETRYSDIEKSNVYEKPSAHQTLPIDSAKYLMICSRSSDCSDRFSDHLKVFINFTKTEMSDECFQMSDDPVKIIRHIFWWSTKTICEYWRSISIIGRNGHIFLYRLYW